MPTRPSGRHRTSVLGLHHHTSADPADAGQPVGCLACRQSLQPWWLIAALAALADRLLTFSYFIPRMVGLLRSAHSPQARATMAQWINLNYVRQALILTSPGSPPCRRLHWFTRPQGPDPEPPPEPDPDPSRSRTASRVGFGNLPGRTGPAEASPLGSSRCSRRPDHRKPRRRRWWRTRCRRRPGRRCTRGPRGMGAAGRPTTSRFHFHRSPRPLRRSYFRCPRRSSCSRVHPHTSQVQSSRARSPVPGRRRNH